MLNQWMGSLLLGHVTKAQLLIKDQQGCTSLHHAARCGDPEIVHSLLDIRADITQLDNQGGTPLHAAVRCQWSGRHSEATSRLGNAAEAAGVFDVTLSVFPF